jgi:hypothetical protein
MALKPKRSGLGAASRLIDQRTRDLGGWRGETLVRMRALILEADPEMTEEWKWMGTPVWSHHGIVCTGEELLGYRCRWRAERNEHFIVSIVFQSKYHIYHCFFGSVRKMSECFSH